MIKVSVLGATGYAGIELVRLLSLHPEVELVHMVSHSFSGQALSDVYPNFKGWISAECKEMNINAVTEDSDVIFTSLPHGSSKEVIPELVSSGKFVIDLSGDFRYRSAKVYEAWYGTSHDHPELLKKAVYGLPELHRDDIRKASLIGNPGCYPTCSILGLAPLLASKAIDPHSIIIDAKSGVSGAGRGLSLTTHFCETHENVKAYNVARHRHTSEIEQELGLVAGQDIMLSFTPHLIPVKRGILSTMYAQLSKEYRHQDILELYRDFYQDEPFVVLHREGQLPEIKYTNGSNRCHIGFVVDARLKRIIVVSALDNLIKGAGGQAIQNMNIIAGLPEKTGLDGPGWYL